MVTLEFTFPGGKLKQEVTSITLVNNVIYIHDETVPTGKLWILLGIKFVNGDNVTRTVTINKYKTASKALLLAKLASEIDLAANGGVRHWPNLNVTGAVRGAATKPAEFLAAGNTLEVKWAAGGASAGFVDADGLAIEYLEIDAP